MYILGTSVEFCGVHLQESVNVRISAFPPKRTKIANDAQFAKFQTKTEEAHFSYESDVA